MGCESPLIGRPGSGPLHASPVSLRPASKNSRMIAVALRAWKSLPSQTLKSALSTASLRPSGGLSGILVAHVIGLPCWTR
jgi:hypothetical protein